MATQEKMPNRENHFCVSAPTIMNAKYADYNSNYCHEDVGQLGARCEERKAIPTTRAVGCDSVYELSKSVRHAFNNVRNSFQDDFELSMGELGMKNEMLVPELANLIENGHVFLDKDLQDKVVDMVAKRKLYEEDKQKSL